MNKQYDFSGWATKNNLKCSDGRTIAKDAFIQNDGTKVPLVWNHQHNSVENILGHALLENRDEGVYAYCKFNPSESGQTAKTLVEHGDVDSLSIFATQIQEKGSSVLHGSIKEVSLVLASANPGAFVEHVIRHDGTEMIDEAIIFADEPLVHSDEENSDDKKEKTDTDTKKDDDKKSPEDIFNSFSEEQKNAVYAIVGELMEDVEKNNKPDKKNDEPDKKNDEPDEKNDKPDESDNKEGGKIMKHNLFDNGDVTEKDILSHSEIQDIVKGISRCGSLRESLVSCGVTTEKLANTIAHAEANQATYGMKNIDYLFPDARNVTSEPIFISRNMAWVEKVMSRVHHTPFSRIKSVFADITEDEARAKGYIKGSRKKEEVFTLLKRTTDPTTVYKKQKFDREDLIHITDFEVLIWIKKEMRMMLDEELARAYLISDGRSSASDDKIKEDHIRPIWKDDDLYTVKYQVKGIDSSSEGAAKAKAFIAAAIRSRKGYQGSGNPDMFMGEDLLTECLLLEDKNERRIYDTLDKLQTALRVNEIVSVPPMEGAIRDDGKGNEFELLGMYVNLMDYNVGTDNGGEVTTFDQFDIDYNQQKYLTETNCSGALTKPFSAVVLECPVKTTTAGSGEISG